MIVKYNVYLLDCGIGIVNFDIVLVGISLLIDVFVKCDLVGWMLLFGVVSDLVGDFEG